MHDQLAKAIEDALKDLRQAQTLPARDDRREELIDYARHHLERALHEYRTYHDG
jgi:hypothetical protein